jgi:hypothetical protein
MNEKLRAIRDIKKLRKALDEFVELGLDKKYSHVYEWIMNYANDAEYFYKKGEYFTSFGAANYAYGFVDCILILEGKKREELK